MNYEESINYDSDRPVRWRRKSWPSNKSLTFVTFGIKNELYIMHAYSRSGWDEHGITLEDKNAKDWEIVE